MPRLAEGMGEGTIVAWLQLDGTEIGVGDELVEIETDEATMTYDAEAAGCLEIAIPVGATAPVHAVIGRLHRSESTGTIPHFHVQADADVGAALLLLVQLEEQGVADPRPSLTDLIVKASALVLREFPLVNSSFRDGQLELHEHVHVGIAVAARDASVVPGVSGADATFTVSDMGMYGSTAIFPVVNPGQAASLGVGAARSRPALSDGALVERTLMTLTLACDHRILYGAEAAAFLSRIAELLESPLRLMPWEKRIPVILF
jgi:pyruvate/2-oxoglutarate dehydrogenase complex dihydrolipoamide acyltransferase (E2) component